jgi:hypothetical protein
MLDRLTAWLSPTRRRVADKRRLEQVAIEVGASRQVAKRIVAIYFARGVDKKLTT